jgi:hypothetical protein
METDIYSRYAELSPEIAASRGTIQVERQGDLLLFLTGTRYLQRQRLSLWVAGGIGIAGGLALTYYTFWGLALALAGFLICLIGPRLVHAVQILTIDGAEGMVKGLGGKVALSEITAVRGYYHTQGWDPSSVVYAEVAGKEEPVALISFRGTDEPQAQYACHLLGGLLNRPASYTGPYGDVKECYTPTFSKSG